MKLKLIIFDLDGVLFDSCALVDEFFQYLYPDMTKEIMDDILCGNFHVEMEKFKLTHTPITETPEEKEARIAMYSVKKSTVPLYKGIKELLEDLKSRGFILTINTSAYEKNCMPPLKLSNVYTLFDFIATVEISKSKVEKFKIIQDKYGAAKEDMIFITDTLGDIREADIAGVPTIAVTYGAQTRARLTGEAHQNLVATVDAVDELKDVLVRA